MSYIVFARKYRPQRFDEIIGQQHVITVLKNGVINKRIPHAMLFSGPRGVGKTTTARILAKALNCEELDNGEPCDTCGSCNSVTVGNNLDVIEIDGASNRGIDEIRELREKAKYATVKGRYKIFIIDEIHMLTKEAFNALLKILEEPPEHVIFIFATTEPFNVLPTILSRCQRFDFKRISLIEIVNQLKYICEKEKINYEPDALNLIARLADGSMRDASSILDQLATSESKITFDSVNSMFGRLDDEFFVNFVDYIIKRDNKNVIVLLNDVLAKGFDLETFIAELAFFIHKLYLIKNQIKTEEINIMNNKLINKLKEQSENFSSQILIQITKELIETASKLKFTNNKKMMVENQLARIVSMQDAKNIDEILEYIRQLRDNKKKSKVQSIEHNNNIEIEKDSNENEMEKFISLIEDEFFICETLKNSKIKKTDKNTYNVYVPETYSNHINKTMLNKLIKKHKFDFKINIIIDKKGNKKTIIKNPLEEHKLVRKIMSEFDGLIVE